MSGPHPIKRFTRYLEKKGWWSKDDDKRVREEMRKEVMTSLQKQAKMGKWPVEVRTHFLFYGPCCSFLIVATSVAHNPFPHTQEMITDVFDTPTDNLLEQLQELQEHKAAHPELYGK